MFTTDLPSPGIMAGSHYTQATYQSGNTVRNAPISQAQKKLRAAAGEFESLLLSNLWKSMKSTFASPDEESSDPGHDTFEEMGIQAMSSAVGRAGGLGLGKLILKHLEPKLEHSNTAISASAGNVIAAPADIPP
jgi:Rod binding domain-containing protein